MCGGEARHERFSADPVEVVFEPLVFLPEGLNVVEWDLDGTVVDFAGGVRVLLPIPCFLLSLFLTDMAQASFRPSQSVFAIPLGREVLLELVGEEIVLRDGSATRARAHTMRSTSISQNTNRAISGHLLNSVPTLP